MSITEFLEARIIEDEALAKECLLPANLHLYGDERIPAIDPSEWGDLAKNYLGGEMGDHCANWNPARVLAECVAKRAIIAGIIPERDPQSGHPDYDPLWIIRELAAVYKDHPDYQQEWAV